MNTKISGTAAFLGLITVIIGAFGAHSLKEKLDPEALQSFETGVRYMMYHVLALLLIANANGLSEKTKLIVSGFFFLGILFFSGSIFIITTSVVEARQIWFITPLGGLFFILGWLITGLSFFRSTSKN
ncbi:DUF423 domain-containing protein [Lutimonas sp.]|uniref:DUF423 domain-containing protein n=1 Tax=Lutimonas sp. TaxID=1872403 RepID=UPI003D9AF531